MADDRRFRKLWQNGVWIALTVVSATSLASNVYTTREAHKCSQQQTEFAQEPHRTREEHQIERDQFHDILGHTEAMKNMVQSQGENLQNPDYYEGDLKTQCQK